MSNSPEELKKEFTADRFEAEAHFHAVKPQNGPDYIVCRMLRQAADTEREVEKLKAENAVMNKEIDALVEALGIHEKDTDSDLILNAKIRYYVRHNLTIAGKRMLSKFLDLEDGGASMLTE